MKLIALLTDIKPIKVIGSNEIDVTGVNIDSRHVDYGHLFVAMKGMQVDGHRFIAGAIERGAKAVMVEDMPENIVDDVTYVQVESTEDALGPVATVFYG